MKLAFQEIHSFEDAQRNFEQIQTALTTPYFASAGKTTVADSDFPRIPFNGTLVVHYDTTANKTYVSARANNAWHVIAGPI